MRSMKFKVSGSRVAIIIVASLGSVLVAHYDELLPYRWQTYVAPDGTFSIEVPGKPTLESKQTTLEGGGTATFHFLNVDATGKSAFTVAYVERQNTTDKTEEEVLESARDGSLRNVQGVLVKQNRIKVQGYPALDVQAHARSNSFLDSRLVIAGDCLYMIMVVAPSEQARDPKSIQRFFDSFKLNVKPPTQP